MPYIFPASRGGALEIKANGGKPTALPIIDPLPIAGARPLPAKAKSGSSIARNPRSLRSTASSRSSQDKHRKRTGHRSDGQASTDKLNTEQRPRSRSAQDADQDHAGEGRSGSGMRPGNRSNEVNRLRDKREEDSSDADGKKDGMSDIGEEGTRSQSRHHQRNRHKLDHESRRPTEVAPREHRRRHHRDKGVKSWRPASDEGPARERRPSPPRRSHSYNAIHQRPNPILSPFAFVRSFLSNTTNLRPGRPPREGSFSVRSTHRSKSRRPRAEECRREAPPQPPTKTKTRERRKRRPRNVFAGVLVEPIKAQKVALKPTKVQCLTCMDDVPRSRAAKLKCSHRMCHACLIRIFQLSVTDPQHMPPKCCTSECISLTHVNKLFDAKFKKTWNIKLEEYSTKNRIYCPKRRCGEWIMSDDIKKVVERGHRGRKGKCRKCKTEVCGNCSGMWHGGRTCPKDDETTRLLETAREKGWQRCYSCRTMVELEEGCNHMTCHCTAEFCMLCGNRWKTCDCPWFNFQAVDDDRLNHMRVPCEINHPNQPHGAGFAAQPRRRQRQVQAPPQGPVGVLQDNLDRMQDFIRQEQANPQLRQRERQRREQAAQRQQVTCQQEMESRRRQEREDAEIARRMQNVDLVDDETVAEVAPVRSPFGNPFVGSFGRNLWVGADSAGSGRPAADARRMPGAGRPMPGAFEEGFPTEERTNALAGLAWRERGSGRVDTWMEHVPAPLAV